MSPEKLKEVAEYLIRLERREKTLAALQHRIRKGEGKAITVEVAIGDSTVRLFEGKVQAHPFLTAIDREISQRINEVDSRRRSARLKMMAFLDAGRGHEQ